MMLVRVVAARKGRRRRVRAEQGRRRRRHGGRDGRRRRGRGTPVEVLLNRVGGLQIGTGEIKHKAEMIRQRHKEVA